jgi:hypothetical protein
MYGKKKKETPESEVVKKNKVFCPILKEEVEAESCAYCIVICR